MIDLSQLKVILHFLAAFNCVPPSDIKINIVEDLENLGYYKDNVVTIRIDASNQVLVHELVHSCQKTAQNYEEWLNNEKKAKYIEMLWLQQH